MAQSKLTDNQIETLFNLACPRCGAMVEPQGCGFPQHAEAEWYCTQDDEANDLVCTWEGTVRDLVEHALVKAGLRSSAPVPPSAPLQQQQQGNGPQE